MQKLMASILSIIFKLLGWPHIIIFLKHSFHHFTFRSHVHSNSMHLISNPFPLIPTLILPLVSPPSMSHPLEECSSIQIAIGKIILAFPTFHTIHPLPFIGITKDHGYPSMALLDIVLPVTGVLVTRLVGISARAVAFA
jgi:hypothetical protein